MSNSNLSCEGKYSSMSETILRNSISTPNDTNENSQNEENVEAKSTKFPIPPEFHEGGNRYANIGFDNIEMEEDSKGQLNSLEDSHTSDSEEQIESKRMSESNKSKTKKFYRWLSNLSFHPLFYQGLLYILLPMWIWLSVFVLVGRDNLPNGTVFVVVILGCVGRLLGFGVELLRLPPMMGMLGLGLIIRNVPYLDFGIHFNSAWSSPIRQTALAVILTRAGLNLDLNVLIRLKAIVLRLAFCPTILEAIGIAIAAKIILDFPWAWGFLLGFVLAPVSPAVVVPRLIELRENGFGVEKGIPTIIIAAASLDNVAAISLFGVTLAFTLSDSSLVYSIIQGPLQIIIGLGFGIIWGSFLGVAFNPSQKNNIDDTLVRAVLTFGGGLISVIGFSKLGFSGGGALGCLLSSFVASCLWRLRGAINIPDPLVWIFAKLWFIFEPLLFGVIGSQIDILSLDIKTVGLGLACIGIGSLIRFLISFLMVTKANLTVKEKLFTSICWSPKATVQAAIGPVALEMARNQNKGPEIEKMGQAVLTLAVLVILLTAPIGELGVMMTGRKFLKKIQVPSTNTV